MDILNIAVTRRLTPDQFREIEAVDPRIKVWDIIDPAEAEAGRIKLPPGQNPDDLMAPVLRQTDILFGFPFPKRILERAPNLKWVQTSTTGFDSLLGTGIFEKGVLVTTAKVHGRSLAEFAMAFMLMLAKDALRLWENQRQRKWQRFATEQLEGKTLGILGLGRVGRALASMAQGFEMRVVATRRSQGKIEHGVEGVETLLPPSHLERLLGQSDFVVICLPLTPETRGVVGEAALRAMKPSAYLINVARGAIVDEAALIRALKEGWIAGAGLDAFNTEPLPQDSELWHLPNVIISPHIAGLAEINVAKAVRLFCHNLRRYLAGEELLQLADREKGY
ncbi:MAG: D-2-hydroxyacid dehydrogenase [Dehalococcoidia bacterium]